MGDLTKPNVQTFDPTNPNVAPLQAQLAQFLQGTAGNDAWARSFETAETRNGADAMNASVGNTGDLVSMLMGQARGGTTNPFSELQFGNQFQEMQNPFGGLGATNQAQQQIVANLPVFSRALGEANRNMVNAAPSRFSGALAEQGADLNSRALQDFNLFTQQALMQGLGLQQQDQQTALNFMLGSRGLQQDAQNAANQSQLGARGLQQDAHFTAGQQGQQGIAQLLQALGMRGQQSQALGQFGLDRTASVMNPTLQLLLGAMGFAQPQGQEAVVGDSILGTIMGGIGTGLGGAAALGWRPFGRREQGEG